MVVGELRRHGGLVVIDGPVPVREGSSGATAACRALVVTGPRRPGSEKITRAGFRSGRTVRGCSPGTAPAVDHPPPSLPPRARPGDRLRPIVR